MNVNRLQEKCRCKHEQQLGLGGGLPGTPEAVSHNLMEAMLGGGAGEAGHSLQYTGGKPYRALSTKISVFKCIKVSNVFRCGKHTQAGFLVLVRSVLGGAAGAHLLWLSVFCKKIFFYVRKYKIIRIFSFPILNHHLTVYHLTTSL